MDMKRIAIGVLMLGLLALQPAAAATDGTRVEWGNAPDFSMLSFEGDELKLSDLAGKPVVLNFWAEWCPPCIAEMPLLEQAYKDYGEDVQFLTINLEQGRMDPAGFMESHGYTIPGALAANQVGKDYGIRSIPATYFISSKGDVLGVKNGVFTDEELPYVLDSLLEFEDSLMVTE